MTLRKDQIYQTFQQSWMIMRWMIMEGFKISFVCLYAFNLIPISAHHSELPSCLPLPVPAVPLTRSTAPSQLHTQLHWKQMHVYVWPLKYICLKKYVPCVFKATLTIDWRISFCSLVEKHNKHLKIPFYNRKMSNRFNRITWAHFQALF